MVFNTLLYAAPKYVIYDNSCNLHEYALNRDPGFFRHSRFLVDRFHWKNHKGNVIYQQQGQLVLSSNIQVLGYFNYVCINNTKAEKSGLGLKLLEMV